MLSAEKSEPVARYRKREREKERQGAFKLEDNRWSRLAFKYRREFSDRAFIDSGGETHGPVKRSGVKFETVDGRKRRVTPAGFYVTRSSV